MKTRNEWIEEASSWVDNWDGVPTLEGVEGECYHIEGIDNPKEYAAELWQYIKEELKERGYEV